MVNAMTETKTDKAYLEDRTVSVPNINNEHCETVFHEHFDDMTGMLDIEVDYNRKNLRLVYDSSKVGFDEIEKTLATIGYPISDTNWSRMKAAMYRFQDENAKNNAHSTESACCSYPRGIYTKGRR
jgi:cation transport ATPase